MISTLERAVLQADKTTEKNATEPPLLFRILVDLATRTLDNPLRTNKFTEQLGFGYGLPKLSKQEGLVWTDGTIVQAYLPEISHIEWSPEGYHVRSEKAFEARTTLLNPNQQNQTGVVALSDVRRVIAPSPYFGLGILNPEDVQEIYRNETL